jgi:HD-like signal output (HDOD) protein
MTQLAVGLRGVATDIAHSFGLFCDVGIALLMPRFPDYAQTLQHAARATDRNFTDVEQAAHRTDHALIGALMARTWSLSTTVCAAIRQHHDAAVLVHPETPEPVARLVAMGMLAELAIQRHGGQAECAEWKRAGSSASATLHLGDGEVEGWISRLCEGFDAT